MERIVEESKESLTCAICTDLFEDPRTLLCSHTFCLHCLIAFRGTDNGNNLKFCPVCRKNAVPHVGQLPMLPKNEFAAEVVSLIQKRERRVEPSAPPAEELEVATDGFYRGQMLTDSREGKKAGDDVIGVALLAGAAAAVAGFFTGGVGAAIVGSITAGLGTVATIDEKLKKRSYVCNGCNNTETSSERFKCGLCQDFILCPGCFGKSNNISQLHNSQHLFLKLKSKPTRELPQGPILKPQVHDITKSLNYQSNVHGRAYIHSPTRIETVPGIKCSHCRTVPIRGTRYKCGMCRDYDLCYQCEGNSQVIHDSEHVFIVIRNQADINVVSEPLCRAYFY